MAKIVSSWNDWDPLKRVIVGRCDNSVIPPEEPATSEKVPVDSEMRGIWGLRPSDTVARGNECLENLVKILEDRGVVVDRPTPLQWNQAIGTPDFRNDSMMTCMPPRDILLTIGNEIMAAANSFRCRYYEYLAYWPLMEEYFEQDPDFKWTQAPRPRLTDRSYKHNYFDEKITLEERLERTAAKDFVTTEVEPMWDAADVMRMGKDLFIQHGLTTNRAAMDWFQRYYPEFRVHAVNFPGDPYPIHIDATFVPLRPGLIINNPHRPLPEPQRAIFEANDWQIVEAAQPAHTEPPALCYSSVWLSMNCLVLDPKTVIVEASEVYQQEQMDKLGMNVIPATCATPTRSAAACTAPPPTSTARASASTTSRTASRIPPSCAPRCGSKSHSQLTRCVCERSPLRRAPFLRACRWELNQAPCSMGHDSRSRLKKGNCATNYFVIPVCIK